MKNSWGIKRQSVQYPVVWQTVKEDIPNLKMILSEVLELDDITESK